MMKFCACAFLLLFFLASTIPDVDAAGLDCFGVCGNKGGPCPSKCGRNGYCCRKDWYDHGCGTRNGCQFYHCCVTLGKREMEQKEVRDEMILGEAEKY